MVGEKDLQTAKIPSVFKVSTFYCKVGRNYYKSTKVTFTLLLFGHFNLNKNNKQTAVINITRQRMLLKLSFMNLTFRVLQNTSSEVTVTIDIKKDTLYNLMAMISQKYNRNRNDG